MAEDKRITPANEIVEPTPRSPLAVRLRFVFYSVGIFGGLVSYDGISLRSKRGTA